MERYKHKKTTNLDDLYVTSGEKLYVIGSQDGNFPNFGRHSVREMGGIWCHPYKLADGFYLSVSEDYAYNWLEKSKSIEVSCIDTTFQYSLKELKVSRKQWSPRDKKGLYITYTFKNALDVDRVFKIAFALKSELMGSWLSETIGIDRGEDLLHYDLEKEVFIGKNNLNPFMFMLGSNRNIVKAKVVEDLNVPDLKVGQGSYCVLEFNLDMQALYEKSITFYLAGGCEYNELVETYNGLRRDEDKYSEEKMLYYQRKLHHSSLRTEDSSLDELFAITKINMNWLIKDIPGIGRGMVAGLPDYPWFFGCDSSYSIPALLAIGEFKLSKSLLRIIRDFSVKENGNGRIVHEISTNGVVPNKGNTQETPHFIIAVLETYKWTQDLEFLKEMYPYCEKGIRWLLDEMDEDKDLFPTGYGIMEIAGLNAELIDTAVYTCEALKSMSMMAGVLDKSHDQEEYMTLHKRSKRCIDERFFMSDEGLYGDVLATAEKVREAFPLFRERLDKMTGGEYHHKLGVMDRLEKRLVRDHSKEEQAWLIYKNWVGLTPLEVGYANERRAESVLSRMTSEEYMGDYGLYIEGLTQKTMMTISTAVLAICQGRYGKIDDMLSTLNFFKKSLHKEMPLSLSELSPRGGCIVQGWTILGTAVPIVNILFGVMPDIENDIVHFKPQMPEIWNEASLENIKIGDSRLSIHFKREHKREVYRIEVLGKPIKIFAEVSEDTKILYV